ncbi:hypothetical protein ACFWUP_05495 [Nocardia sp. NPDC058658]|uniref:hypothetical protein n=1 Tax=Nocardia sp. NPDC058658 TaxID=3346580 RepID=UPI003647478C
MSESGERGESGAQPLPRNPVPPQANSYAAPFAAPPNPYAQGVYPNAQQNYYAQPPYGGPQPYGYAPGQHPPQFHAVAPPRASKTPIVLAALAVLVVLAVGIAVAVVFATSGNESSPERQARSSLATAQMRLLHTPAVRYTGTVTGGAAGSPTLTVDLIVTNVGEATGTVSVGNAHMDYLGVGGKSFLQGEESAWIALGVPAGVAKDYVGRPILIGPDVFGVDLATTLAPARLALILDPAAAHDKPVQLGTLLVIGGHESTPIISGGLTIYLRDLGADGTADQPIIDRIVNNPYDHRVGKADLPRLTLDTEHLLSADAAAVYAGLPGRIDALDRALDSRVSVDGTLNGRFLENPCLGTCTIEFTVANTVDSTSDIRITALSYDYTITVESQLNISTGADCAGAGTMAPNSSTTIRCTATYDPYQIPAGTTLPINAFAKVSIRALNPEQVRALKEQVGENGSAANGLSPEVEVSVAEDWTAYTAAGGKLSKSEWTTARTELGDRANR